MAKKQKPENNVQKMFFKYFFDLGVDRNLYKVFKHFEDTPQRVSYVTVKSWAQKFDWKGRVRAQLEGRNAESLEKTIDLDATTLNMDTLDMIDNAIKSYRKAMKESNEFDAKSIMEMNKLIKLRADVVERIEAREDQDRWQTVEEEAAHIMIRLGDKLDADTTVNIE